jgi:predicted O-methyltransferase YrrM
MTGGMRRKSMIKRSSPGYLAREKIRNVLKCNVWNLCRRILKLPEKKIGCTDDDSAAYILEHIEWFFKCKFQSLPVEQQEKVANNFFYAHQWLFNNKNLYDKIYAIAESYGIHITPRHYYSPIPDSNIIDKYCNQMIISQDYINFNEEEQLRFFRDYMIPFSEELYEIPRTHVERGFYWGNMVFPPIDALSYYTMIRSLKPKTIVEVGSGYSTIIAERAAEKNGFTRVIAIEPYPFEFYNKHLKGGMKGLNYLIEKPIQDVDVEIFDNLEAGDILFIDSSHVSKLGSDVNFLFFKVIPRLKPGVVIHFHDIALPFDYPKEFVREQKRFWNENYMLASFLLSNDEFVVRFGAVYFLSVYRKECCAELADFLAIALGGDPEYWEKHVSGSSFWVERVA